MQLPNTAFSTDRPLPLLGSVSLGDTLGAVARDTSVTNPAGTIGNVKDLTVAREGPLRVNRVGSIREGVEADSERLGPSSKYLGLDEQVSLLDEVGLKGQIEPYEGETLDGLNLRIKWRQDELKTQGILAASQQGVGTTVASFATGIGVSLLDPINIASGFVPVVGPARYANALRRASGPLERAAIRTRVGALEGAVGAGLVEPLVLYGADIRAADYDIYDSLFNLVAGSVLGGGLHAVGGGFADLASRRELESAPPEVKRDAMAAGVAALAEGRKPVVTEAIIRESAFSKAELMGSTTLARAEQPNIRAGSEASTQTLGRSDTLGDAGTLGRDEVNPERGPAGVPDTGIDEPPVREGFTRVYHSGERGDGNSGRWVSTNREYAANYRSDLPLYYLDVPKDDPRVRNADYPEQSVERGFTFNFEATPAESAQLREIRRGEKQAAASRQAADAISGIGQEREPLETAARRAHEPQNRVFAKEQSAAAQRAAAKMRPANDDIAALERDIAETVAETDLMQEAAPVKADTAEIDAATEAVEKARETGLGLKRAAACLLSIF